MTTTLDQLRHSYPQFTYESFSFEHRDGVLHIRFRFVVEPDIIFTPHTTIESIDADRLTKLNPAVLENLIFHLGLIEMISYWKATCSPRIVVQAGYLDTKQIAWWTDLFLHGMREFFYVNQINYKQKDFFTISTRHQARVPKPLYTEALQSETDLLLLSGGKDSALTVQMLREGRKPFNAILLNPVPAAYALAAQAGCPAPIIVRRVIDPALLKLNKQGYLNGHTPFSAYLATLGVVGAVLFNYQRILVSNERSCDESYVEFLGSEVNHQYSKTLRFERLFQWYTKRYLAKEAYYFSFLRPLYEIQITQVFARYPEYFAIFKSCNRNLKENSWCGNCPKCLFIFTALYPFLDRREIRQIFGEDLFQKEQSIPFLCDLLGFYEHKPFECVGTKREVLAALYMSVQQLNNRSAPLPTALQYVDAEVLPLSPDIAQIAQEITTGWGEQHTLPESYVATLKQGISALPESA
jgi:hypothetical protein